MPEIGREFKPLAEVLEVDHTNTGFSVIDPDAPGHIRPLALADRYADAELLALPPGVPDGIRGYFDAARMLWVHGWLYYPFYTWASLHASICVEMALKQRFREDSVPLPKARRRFEGMLHEAVDRGWVRPEGMTRIRERYNNPQSQTLREFMRRELGAEIFAPTPAPEEALRESGPVRALRRDSLEQGPRALNVIVSDPPVGRIHHERHRAGAAGPGGTDLSAPVRLGDDARAITSAHPVRSHQPQDLRDAPEFAIRIDDPAGLALRRVPPDQCIP